MLSNTEFQQKQIIFALLSRGEKLSFKNDNVIISDDEGVKHQSTCYRLFALFIVGHSLFSQRVASIRNSSNSLCNRSAVSSRSLKYSRRLKINGGLQNPRLP